MIDISSHISLTNRLLEQFLAVAEEKHFGRAAQALGMRQPPLSQSIQRLERLLGVELFDRGPKGVRLTAAGEVFAVDAQRLLAAQAAAVERVRRVAAGLEGDIRVGYTTVLSHQYLPRMLRAAAEELPGLRLHLHQDTPAALEEMVRVGSLDLAFARDPSRLPDDLVSEDFAAERIAAAVPGDSPLAEQDAIDLADLRDQDFALPDAIAMPALALQVQLACRDAGFTPRSRAVADDVSGLFSHVASGLSVSLLPGLWGGYSYPGVAFVPLRGASPYLETKIVAIHRPDADAAVRRVLELINRYMAA